MRGFLILVGTMSEHFMPSAARKRERKVHGVPPDTDAVTTRLRKLDRQIKQAEKALDKLRTERDDIILLGLSIGMTHRAVGKLAGATYGYTSKLVRLRRSGHAPGFRGRVR
jgi:hypothetical protein